jgi:hypothetical protein
MSEFTIKIHDLSTNEIIEREMTAEEIETLLKTQADAQREQLEAEQRKAQRAELLERLGLTEDEAKVLLG